MQIDIIDNFEAFIAIRNNWNSVYKADPQAQFFLSWDWLAGWLPMVHEPWFILAAKPSFSEAYTAFFPLKVRLAQQDGGNFYTELCMAGNSIADYAGLICLPGYEEEDIPAFAKYLQQELSWSSFHLQSILETDARMHLLLSYFSEDNFEFSQCRILNKAEETNNYIAPYVSLVDDWDIYLQNYVSSNTRQKIRRFLRKIDSSDQLHITHVDANNLELHTEILLKFWQATWGDRKGDNCVVIMNYVRAIVRHCFEHHCLYFPVLWREDTPLGAIANFIDVRQKSILFFIAGRDESVKDLSPGLILHADAIRYAIRNGFKVYDFLKGNESYKYSFGVKERRIQHIIAKQKDFQNKKLDLRVIPLALKQTIQYHQTNQLTAAEQGYQQILEAQPNHAEALYGLAALMKQKGEYQTAEQLAKHLLTLQPDSVRAWFSLGNLYQTQENLLEAIAAYRQAVTLQPKSAAVYNNLGYALQQQGDWEAAIACYQTAMELQPNCIEAEVNWANALYTQGQLPSEKQMHYAALNNHLGSKCRQAGDLKTATVYYQQSILMNSGLAETYHNLGTVLEAQGKAEAAITCYQKALDLKTR